MTTFQFIKNSIVENTEIRVSYPATMPAVFQLSASEQAPNDTLPFPFDDEIERVGAVDVSVSDDAVVRWISVTAEYAGESTFPGMEHQPIIYNLVVEQVVAGLPRHTYPMVAFCVLILLVCLFWAMPRLRDFLHAEIAAVDARGTVTHDE